MCKLVVMGELVMKSAKGREWKVKKQEKEIGREKEKER